MASDARSNGRASGWPVPGKGALSSPSTGLPPLANIFQSTAEGCSANTQVPWDVRPQLFSSPDHSKLVPGAPLACPLEAIPIALIVQHRLPNLPGEVSTTRIGTHVSILARRPTENMEVSLRLFSAHDLGHAQVELICPSLLQAENAATSLLADKGQRAPATPPARAGARLRRAERSLRRIPCKRSHLGFQRKLDPETMR